MVCRLITKPEKSPNDQRLCGPKQNRFLPLFFLISLRKNPSFRRKDFFTVRVVEHWKRLPGEAVEAPLLSVSPRGWDNALTTVL